MDVAPYNAQQANINSAWDNAKTQIKTQRDALGTQYGGTFDPSGRFNIDNTSQFGATQSLRMNQGLSLVNNDASEATRGIGKSGFGLAGQQENLMRYGQGQQQFDLLNQAQNAYMGTVANDQNAETAHASDSTTLGISKAGQLALENSWQPAPSSPVPGMPTSPIPGVGNSSSSYLPPSILASAANKSKAPKIGQSFNSGVHAM